MNKLVFAVIFSLLCNASFAQTPADSIPGYAKMDIPPFTLTLVPDSSVFTKDMLKKKKKTIIMIFSPDCSHCEHSTKDLLAHYEAFKNVQIIMVTNLGYAPAEKFYKDLNIANYPNIKIGVDPSYNLGSFYEVKMFPSIFLYDKKGRFKKTFDGENKWEDIGNQL